MRVLYGPDDDVFFVGGEAANLALYQIPKNRSGVRQIIATPTAYLYHVSPDDKWVAVWVGTSVAFYPVAAGRHGSCARIAERPATRTAASRRRWSGGLTTESSCICTP